MATQQEATHGMERWKGRTALVTGASSGIGYAVTKKLIQYGVNVVGCAPPGYTEKIDELAAELASAPGKLLSIVCDVRKEDQILNMFQFTKDKFGGVDICICNAGLAHNSTILGGDTSDWKDMWEINVLGLCICAREAVKQMRERGVDDGHVILVDSLAAHQFPPTHNDLNFYCLTKSAVLMATEGIRKELRGMNTGIRVTSLSPGNVRTGFHPHRFKETEDEKVYGPVVKNFMEPDDLADAMIYSLSAPPRVQIHNIMIRPTYQEY